MWTGRRPPATLTDLRIVEELRRRQAGPLTVCFGTVDVTSQVVGYQRRRIASGEVLGEEALDLPPRDLRTRAVWYLVPPGMLERGRARRGGRPRCRPRRRARGDRPAAALGDVRPLGHRRGLHRAASRHRRDDGLRLRRRARRRRIRRARIPTGGRLAGGDEGRDRRLRVPLGLPVVRAIAQVRKRQRTARQGRRLEAAGRRCWRRLRGH